MYHASARNTAFEVAQTLPREALSARKYSPLPTVETIRNLVQRNEGVAFLPKMCVAQEIEQGRLCEVRVPELAVERKIYLVYPSRRKLSHAAQAFLGVVAGSSPA